MVHYSKKAIKSFVEQSKTHALSAYSTAMSFPSFAYGVDLCSNWLMLLKDMTVHLLQDYHIRRLMDTVLSKASFMTTVVMKSLDIVTSMKENDNFLAYSLLLEPSRGYLNYEQNLPFNWYTFEELPVMINSLTLADPSPPDIKEFYMNLMDVLRSVHSIIKSKSLVPPFSATAMLIGDEHLITFDGKIYDFAGECNYLLLSDFGFDRFSLIGKYQRKKRLSLIIRTDNIKWELFKDGRVYVNNVRTELPIMANNSYIRQENNRIIFYNKQGFIINCNVLQNICSVKLSGWYFGRTGGLLGVYDNEASNDWMLPNRELAQDLPTFVSAWRVNPTCQDKYVWGAQETDKGWDRVHCKARFLDSDSNLRSCFGEVDPTPFYNVCLREINSNRTSMQQGLCLSTAAYIEECRVNGIKLDQLQECVHCSFPDGLYPAGASPRYSNVKQRSADVIFVVDQKSCVQQWNYTTLVPLLESSFAEKGFVGNRYAVVGYGGMDEFAAPHTFTASNNVFTDAKGVQTIFERYFSHKKE